MAAEIVDGVVLAGQVRDVVREEVRHLAESGVHPHLLAVEVGEDRGSRMYVRSQARACRDVGIRFSRRQVPAHCSQGQLIAEVSALGDDPDVTGIILQMPLPPGIDARVVRRAIPRRKDVEGMSPDNMGMLVYGDPYVAPCTAQAAVALLEYSGVDIAGKEAVVVGHSDIVGKPLALLLLRSRDAAATVTVCHIATRDLAAHTREADILIVAAGVPGLIRGTMIKKGAVVVDVGTNSVPVLDENGEAVLGQSGKTNRKTVGDVAFDEAVEVASKITPVPGGVGPMTVAMLLRNTVACARHLLGS